MHLLRKTWFRIIVSLLGGGLTSELINISTGDPNRPSSSSLTLVYAVILYAVLTFIVKRADKKSL